MGFAKPDQSRPDEEHATEEKTAKRSALPRWFRRKKNDDDLGARIDVTGGLNRVLKANAAAQRDHFHDDHQIRSALAAIEAALYVVDQIHDIIDQAYEVALSAQDAADAGARALRAESYDELRLSINKVLDNLDDNADHLLGKNPRQVDIALDGKAKYSVSPIRLDISAKGLNLSPPRNAFDSFEEITNTLGELDSALRKADRAAAGYCRDAQYLIARLATKTPQESSDHR